MSKILDIELPMYLSCKNCDGRGFFYFSGYSQEQILDICESINAHVNPSLSSKNKATCNICLGEGKTELQKLELQNEQTTNKDN